MSTIIAEPPTEAKQQEPSPVEQSALQYRAVYSGAVIAGLIGLASLFMLFATEFLEVAIPVALIPLTGIGMSLAAMRKISKNQTIYTGRPFATLGLVLSVTMLLYGVGRASFIHITEVPDGYERISFATLKPSQKDEEASRPIPKDAIDVMENATPIFIKGYIRPGSTDSRSGATQFLLVRDNNQCCFGDLSKVQYFDQILVRLDEAKTLSTDLSVTRVGGRLVCIPENYGRGAQYPVYALQADHLE